MQSISLSNVLADPVAILDLEGAFADARSGGVEFSLLGYSEFELKRMLAADISFMVSRSGHTFSDAAQLLKTSPEAVEKQSKGLVAGVDLRVLVDNAKTLSSQWQAEIPDFVHAGLAETLWLFEAQSKSTLLRMQHETAQLRGN